VGGGGKKKNGGPRGFWRETPAEGRKAQVVKDRRGLGRKVEWRIPKRKKKQQGGGGRRRKGAGG